MLTIKGFDRAALAIAVISLTIPFLMPQPGSALQRTSYTSAHSYPTFHRRVIANNVVQKLQAEGNFRMFIEALNVTGMASMLETSRGPYTVFAPNDRAFASLSRDSFKHLFEDKARLKNILKNHIVQKRVESADMKFDSLRTLGGDFLMTNVNSAKTVTVAGAVVVKPDIFCRNGVVHSIDSILFPLTGMENVAMSDSTGSRDSTGVER